ncbi:hypothetical protein BDF20DRAFT_177504 [Mycotypha africana]|uniref:uncharacterized protein n=1 Tax=Mycotypha africana TaxID=64632 RepID=UPI00230182E5|nr:uncharacterized protein BDF20DRAFT_177504 [Mycotypha africana]KAI8968371.1 hypothetical protein BDF20DRAFT_177504 [Mycotypha africana]
MKNYHNSHKRPKLGLFNKGKSSANGISIPELVFSENKFLTRKHYMMAEGKVSSARNSLPSNAKASYNTVLSRKCEEAKNRTPSISKFFSNNNGSHRLSLSPINSAATTNASMLRKKTISSMKSCSNINEALINTGTAVCDRSKTLPSSINERKQTKAVNNTVATGINSTATSVSSQHCSSPVTYRLRNLQDLFAQNQHQQHNDGITDRLTDSFSSQRAQPNQNRRNALDKNNTPLVISVSSLSSSCSNASIKQLLRECQDSILSYCSSNANCNTQYQQNCKPTRAVWKPALQAVSNTPVLQLMPSYAPPRPCYYPSSAFFSNSSSSLVFYNDYNQALDQPQHQMQHRHATATYYKCDNRTTTMSKSKKEGMVYADDSEESCIMYDRFSFAQHYQEQKQQQPTPSTFHPSTPSQCRQQASYYYSHSTTATTDQQQQQSHQYADNQLSSISKTNHNKRNIIAISISSDNSSSVKDSHSFVSPIQDIESNNLKCQIRNNHTLNGKCNNSISYISSRMKSANSNDSDNSSLILLEPTMAVFNDERNSVNDSINDEEEDLNLQNFWLEQSYKRKL